MAANLTRWTAPDGTIGHIRGVTQPAWLRGGHLELAGERSVRLANERKDRARRAAAARRRRAA